jgi:hypothetical protein
VELLGISLWFLGAAGQLSAVDLDAAVERLAALGDALYARSQDRK